MFCCFVVLYDHQYLLTFECRHVVGTKEEQKERREAMRAVVSGTNHPTVTREAPGTTKMEDVQVLIRRLGACTEGSVQHMEAKADLVEALIGMDVSQLDGVVKEVNSRRSGGQ
jgi:aconitase A